MATHSSMLAWRIPMDRGAWWATVNGITESDTVEQLNTAWWSPMGLLSLPSCVPVAELFWGLVGLMQVTCISTLLQAWHVVSPS